MKSTTAQSAILTYAINISVIALVCLATLGVTALALANKVSGNKRTSTGAVLTVQKKEFKIVSATSGTVSKVVAKSGTFVKKGDLLAETVNEIRDRQITVLESFGNANASAQTQLVQLQIEKEKEKIYAPTTGVLANIDQEGEYIWPQQQVGLIYAAEGVVLTASITADDFKLLQQHTGPLNLTQSRLERDYQVNFVGSRTALTNAEYQESKIGAEFSFVDPADAVNMLQNEKLKLDLTQLHDDSQNRPFQVVLDWYDSLLTKLGADQ